MKASYLSAEARHGMQNQSFPWASPGRSGNPFVKDGCWTGRSDNSNHTKRLSIPVATVAFTSPDRTKGLGITTPNFGKAPKRNGK